MQLSSVSRKCLQKYCRRDADTGRYFCVRCRQRRWREKNPIKASYNNLKANAKKRKKPFHLTLEEFTKFAVKTEYIIKKGHTKTAYQIDRKNPYMGYFVWNIQVLTCSENISKGNKERVRNT